MTFSSSDLIDLIGILSPQLSYTSPSERKDGFLSRPERALAIVRRGRMRRVQEHAGGVCWRVPSYSRPHLTHIVWLDKSDGSHECTCSDRQFCSHKFAAGIAELSYQKSRRQPNTLSRKKAVREWERAKEQAARVYERESDPALIEAEIDLLYGGPLAPPRDAFLAESRARLADIQARLAERERGLSDEQAEAHIRYFNEWRPQNQRRRGGAHD